MFNTQWIKCRLKPHSLGYHPLNGACMHHCSREFFSSEVKPIKINLKNLKITNITAKEEFLLTIRRGTEMLSSVLCFLLNFN